MKLEMRGQMRLEQRMKLAPHMIQSMEILQLPILALQERIEQELNSNPVLEIEESADSENVDSAQTTDVAESPEASSESESESEQSETFERFDNLDDGYKQHINEPAPLRRQISYDDFDPKLEAIKNTAASPHSLHEHLIEQWCLVDATVAVKKAGEAIIDYIDNRGYLTVRLEQLHNKDKADYNFDDLKDALTLIQKLEPTGVGARNLKECLLIQMAQSGEYKAFEQQLVSGYMEPLLDNRLPEIARKMKCSVDDINKAIERMSRLDTSPGLQIEQSRNHRITADVIVERIQDSDEYSVQLADFDFRGLRINNNYAKMAKDNGVNEKTKTFLRNNIRSGQWIIDAIEQRKNTLLKVSRAVVKHQKDFFDMGRLYLRPLPMSRIAEEVGVHLATVSRAVAGKYLQCSWGVLPLRKFFSGGTEDNNGRGHSWEAIRAKLRKIIDSEDKSKPLSDDKIKKILAQQGIDNLARRTIAKYRKLMNIPAARYRKKF